MSRTGARGRYASAMDDPRGTERAGSPGEVLGVALRLGLTSFGGAVAHFGYFRREYVERRRWLDEATFADLLALAQSLPGPASSQLGMSIGYRRAGLRGALAAWLGFTLPSAVILVGFATATTSLDLTHAGWVHGLKLAASRSWRAPSSRCGARWRRTCPGRALALVAGARRPRLDIAVRPAGHDRRRGARRAAPPAAGRFGSRVRPGSGGACRAAGGARSRSLCSASCCSGCRSSGWRPAHRSWRRSTRSTGAARSCSAAATSCCRCCTRPSSTRAG